MTEQVEFDVVTQAMVRGVLDPEEAQHGYVCLFCGAEHNHDGWVARRCKCGGLVAVAVRPKLLLPIAEAAAFATLLKALTVEVDRFARSEEESLCMVASINRVAKALHVAGMFV